MTAYHFDILKILLWLPRNIKAITLKYKIYHPTLISQKYKVINKIQNWLPQIKKWLPPKLKVIVSEYEIDFPEIQRWSSGITQFTTNLTPDKIKEIRSIHFCILEKSLLFSWRTFLYFDRAILWYPWTFNKCPTTDFWN